MFAVIFYFLQIAISDIFDGKTSSPTPRCSRSVTYPASRHSWLQLSFAGLVTWYEWATTDWQRSSSTVSWKMVHELVVVRERDIKTRSRPTLKDAVLDLETLVMERSKWRSLCETSIQQFEFDRIRALEAKREQRKTATIRSAACYPCQICGQTCASRIGLYSHSRMHQHWLRSGIRRVDGPVQQPTIISQHL